MGTIIISCIITNILVILVACAIIYRAYKLNEIKVNESIEVMKSKLDDITTALEETKYVIVDLSEEVRGIQDEVDSIEKDERNKSSD